jgi:spectrin alpha
LQEETEYKDKVSAKIEALNKKIPFLAKAMAAWKLQLQHDHDFQQFNWKADVVDSWIGMMCQGQVPSGLRNPDKSHL